VSLTPCGKLADATFPQALEDPPSFPQTHSPDDEISLLTAHRGTNGIASLASSPGPDGVVKLSDVSPPPYRVREADCRIMYAIYDDRLMALVVRAAHRSETYRR